MRVICAWCRAIVDLGKQGDATTHTMCAGCTHLTDDERDALAQLDAAGPAVLCKDAAR
jgi:cytosine/adenosine deaminase-related metal-dependent hydrolase